MRAKKLKWNQYFRYAMTIIGVIALLLIFETFRLQNTGFRTKTLWDWMELLIIPLALAGGAFYLNQAERTVEREIATDHQQEAALQAYLDRMAELLLKESLRTTENEEVRNVARIRTLTVLRGLDAKRKRMALLFLYESGLIAQKAVINLQNADLSEADLDDIDLREANLRGADLSRSHLIEAKLEGADLVRAKLSHANLTMAYLQKANLVGADLEWANLHLAQLEGAKLCAADFIHADISGAYLTDANLSGANISDQQLATVHSLKGATLPYDTKND